jgi:hypothetical protein
MDLQACLDEDNLTHWKQLNSYDFKVFDDEAEAEAWLKEYISVLRGLSNAKICKSRDLPAILYKRRYIAQTLMREKMQTFRHYAKPWKPGQCFNLHDQTYFLTVQLKRITETDQGFRYDFDLP